MQDLPHETLSFRDFTLDLTRGCLLRGEQEVKLRPKSFETLKHLVENSGRLISKNELIGAVWPETSVTDDSLVQCLIDVRRALGSEGQRIVKTVPRRGYIFDVEVTRNGSAHSDVPEATPTVTVVASDTVASPRVWSHSRALQAGAVLALVATAGLIFWLLWRSQQKPAPEIKTLAVLPFRSQIPDDGHDYLGIANEIIMKVSNTGAVTVRPTSSVRKYANQEVDALTAARDLQVVHLLREGHVSLLQHWSNAQ